MSITFVDLKSKLKGRLDVLPPAMLGDIINDSLLDIYNSNEWGFLNKKDIIRTPAIIDTGLASVTKYGELVTLDATASAIVLALDENSVPLIERQFRNQSVSANIGTPFAYNIIDFDTTDPDAIILTLDQPYWDKTNSAAKFQILKIFYNPPFITNSNGDQVIDFKHWKYFIDLKCNRRLYINTTLDQLNKFDPSRHYVDFPRHVVAHPPASDADFPKFELYPAPKFERVYQVIYQRRGTELINERDVAPATLDRELILKRAEYNAYKWMLANLHKYPEIKGSSGRFQNLMALCINPNDPLGYMQMLDRAIKKDEENYPKAFFGDYARMSWIDSFIGNFPYLNEFDGGEYSLSNVAILNF